MSNWSYEIPKIEGWYWIKYPAGGKTIICPCEIVILQGSRSVIHTARNDIFTDHTRNLTSFKKAQFGPSIPLPPLT